MRKKKWVRPFLEENDTYLKFNKEDTLNKIVYVEIGMGMGDFITESAYQNPDIFYIGLEKEETCVARAIKKAEEKELKNLKILLSNAEIIDETFLQDSIDLIYLHFSDPWPKKRNHKRRLTYPSFLNKYEKVLKNNGRIIIKTDNRGLFDDSLEYFKESNFVLDSIDYDYHNDNEPMTAYQEKFISEGKPIYYAKYILNKV